MFGGKHMIEDHGLEGAASKNRLGVLAICPNCKKQFRKKFQSKQQYSCSKKCQKENKEWVYKRRSANNKIKMLYQQINFYQKINKYTTINNRYTRYYSISNQTSKNFDEIISFCK